jgi:hypothetical protein
MNHLNSNVDNNIVNNMDHIIKNYRICYKPSEPFPYCVQTRWLFLWVGMGFGELTVQYFSSFYEANRILYSYLKKKYNKKDSPEYYQPHFNQFRDKRYR